VTILLWMLLATTLVVSAILTQRVWRERQMAVETATGLAGLAIAAPLAALIAVFVTSGGSGVVTLVLAAFAFTLSGLSYLVADRFDNVPAGEKSEHTRLGVNAYAAGCLAAATLAFVLLLDRGYLTLWLGVIALTTALFAVIDKIGSLRVLTALVLAGAAARTFWDPVILSSVGGAAWGRSWTVAAYLWLTLASMGAALILQRGGVDLMVQACRALAIIFALGAVARLLG
jgi:hypothetical protein